MFENYICSKWATPHPTTIKNIRFEWQKKMSENPSKWKKVIIDHWIFETFVDSSWFFILKPRILCKPFVQILTIAANQMDEMRTCIHYPGGLTTSPGYYHHYPHRQCHHHHYHHHRQQEIVGQGWGATIDGHLELNASTANTCSYHGATTITIIHHHFCIFVSLYIFCFCF